MSLVAVFCLPVPCLTLKLRVEGHSKLKIGRNEAHDMDDPCTYLVVERAKVKVTRMLNAVTENQPYLQNGRAYELQT